MELKQIFSKNLGGGDSSFQKRIQSILGYLTSNLKEKDEAVRLALLASIAGESVFFLGPPGTAKSLVSRRVCNAFKGTNGEKISYFEYLMNQFSTPDEVFGPVSLKALENDEYKRITEGFLPDADVAFLDEIWKAGPAIQNTLLTIINEKKFHNGKEVKQVPLKALISASNELPAENQGLEALWDRFLIRTIVNPVQNEKNFLDLVCGSDVKAELKPTEDMLNNLISIEELEQWKEKIAEIEVPEDVRNVIIAIKKEMVSLNKDENRKEKEKFYVSDRRWKKIVNILKTSAFLNGRSVVDLMDLQLVEYCIWNTESQIKEAKEIVKNCIEQNGLEVDTAIDDINVQIKDFERYVHNKFYEWNPPEKGGPKKYKMNNGEAAYILKEIAKINSCRTIEISFISEESYFDKDRDEVNDSYYDCFPCNIEINGNELSFDDKYRKNNYGRDYHHKFSIEMEPDKEGKFVKSKSVFETDDLYELRKNKADDEKYKIILDNIDRELTSVGNYISEKSTPYMQNLFADKKMCDVIMTAVEKSRLELEKAKEDLEKVRNLYKK